ncbi:MAG: 30S ribosomal protein S12 methylthiotransferase RimO [Planctomycetes bacterium]|nr:30S ribosomal protein S12 methylthiotransferase RimO [Planctomycetota bacterium]
MSRKSLPTVALVSLGCPKNLVDSERMLAGLALGGFAVTTDADGADVAIVNTCAFLDLARAESDQHLDALEALKRRGRLGRIVVAGCMAQRYGRQVLQRHPGVDAVVGIAGRDELAGICRRVLSRPRQKRGRARPGAARPLVCVGPHAAAPPDDRERLRLTPRHYAYLRISEGCDNRCAYCAIPEIRGPLRSKPPDQVLAEAEELVADGAKELILIAQDTTAYGRDFAAHDGRLAAGLAPPAASLAHLLHVLRERIRVPWLRLMYTHPASFGEDVIAELAAGPPLVPYVDLPLQHISDALLESMGRRAGRAGIERLIARLRSAAPGIALRTSFIVGYPGETDAHFEELLGFVEKVRFDHVGVFMYSAEAGTRAAGLPDQVPAAVARERWERLMQAAERLAAAAAEARRGQVLEVLVDGAEESGRLVARHAGQAPEVDGVVLLAPGTAATGQFVQVRITGAEGYDLVAEVERKSKFKVQGSKFKV